MKYAMMAEREIMRRLPAEYPYTIEQAMEHIRREIPDFSLGEFEARWMLGELIGCISMAGCASSPAFCNTLRSRVRASPSAQGRCKAAARSTIIWIAQRRDD